MARAKRVAMRQVKLNLMTFNLNGTAFVANCYHFVRILTGMRGRGRVLGIRHRHGAAAKRDNA
jgi:hypothetical protein